MNALLLKKTDLIVLSRKDIQLQHLNKGVAVLWSELNGEFEEVLGLCVIEMFVVPKVGHGKASSFAPDLTGLGDLLQSLIERVEHLLKVFFCEGTCVLELDESSPQPSCCEVYLKGLMNQVLCLAEASTPNLEQDSLEVSLPFCLRNSLSVQHDLAGTLCLAPQFEVLRILEHGHRHLLLRHFIATSLDDFSRSFTLSKVELDP